MKKRIVSLLCVFAMLLSICPVVMADAAVQNTVLTPTGDFHTSGGAATPKNEDYVRTSKSTTHYTGNEANPHFGYANISVFSYDITNVYQTLAQNEGYVVKSVKFKPYGKYYKANASNLVLDFALVKNQWEEGTVTGPMIHAGTIFPAMKDNGPTFSGKWGTPDFTLTASLAERISAGTYTKYAQDVYDITDLFKKHMSTTSDENKNFFSFAMEIQTDGSFGAPEYDIASKENEPYGGAAIEVEYKQLKEMSPVSDPVIPKTASEDFSIEFNNDIASATVTLNGAEVTPSINGAILSIGSFEQFKDYSLTVSVTDSYGSSFADTYNFTLGRDVCETTLEMNRNGGQFYDSAYLANGKNTETSLYGEKNVWYNYNNSHDSDSVVLMRIPLPEVPATGFLDKAIFRFTENGTSTPIPTEYWRLFKFPGEGWNIDRESENAQLPAARFNDENVQEIMGDYETYKAGDCFKSENYLSEKNFVYADVTDYANECIKKGQKYIYLGVTAEKITIKVRTHADSFQDITYTVANQAVIEYENIVTDVKGSIANNVAFNLCTVFDKDDLLAALSLVDEDGKAVEGAEFTYAANKVSLSPIKLDEEKTYKVVIAEGTEDIYGNKVSADKSVVCEFETDVNYSVENFAFAVAEVSETRAGATVTNNTPYELTALIAVAAYGNNNELVALDIKPFAIASGEVVNCATESIDATSASKIKAFIWNGADYSPLAACLPYPQD